MDCTFELECTEVVEERIKEILTALESSGNTPNITYNSATVQESPRLSVYTVTIDYSGELELSNVTQRSKEILLYSTTQGEVVLKSFSNTSLVVDVYDRA